MKIKDKIAVRKQAREHFIEYRNKMAETVNSSLIAARKLADVEGLEAGVIAHYYSYVGSLERSVRDLDEILYRIDQEIKEFQGYEAP